MVHALGFEAQEFMAPDGTKMVILRRDDWELVCELATKAAEKIEDEIMNIPHGVAKQIKLGINPIAAWRRHVRLTQKELADQVGVTQAAIARIEALPPGSGRDDTLTRIADVLGAPLAQINPPPTTLAERLQKAVGNSTDKKTGRLLRVSPANH